MEKITFKNYRAISNVPALRSVIPLKDGDLFNVALVRRGLENLRRAYTQIGFINMTSLPETRVDQEHQTVSLEVGIDEDKPFFVSSVSILGVDEGRLQDIAKRFPLKSGDVYNLKLVDLFVQEHA